MTHAPLPSPSNRLALQRLHVGLLHAPGARGRIALARDGAGGWDEALVANSGRALREATADAGSQFVSQLRFNLRRHTGCVEAIGSAFLDLDFRGAGLPFADHDLAEVVALVLYAIAEASLPVPSWITDSGNGIHLVWTFSGLGRVALPRWRRLMQSLRGPCLDALGNVAVRCGRREPDAREAAWTTRMLPLWRMLRDLGLDRGATDPARVLRLWGSINPKGGRMARCAWPDAPTDIAVADFDGLCDAACPMTRAELRALRVERKAAAEANPDAVRAARPRGPRRSPAAKWATVFAELHTLREARGGIARGMRDWWTLFAAVALSQTEGGDAQAWAEQLAPLVGLPVREVAAALSGVERGMRAHQAGETVDHDGVRRPAFYDYSLGTIVERLGITDEEAADLGLRLLVPGGARPLTAAERQRECRRRRSPNSPTRTAQVEARLAIGRRAWTMRVAGMTIAECATELGCSAAQVSKAIDHAEAHPDGVVTVEVACTPILIVDVPATGSETVENVYDVSHSIVVSDPQPASKSLRLPPLPASASPPAPPVRASRPRAPAAPRQDRSAAPSSPSPQASSPGSIDRYTPAQRALIWSMQVEMAQETERLRRVAKRASRFAGQVRHRHVPGTPLAPLDPSVNFYLHDSRGY
ncbi:hypothetical protein MKK68_02370 [Methylobacterium sp. E-016]|uniref:hypothetical protein n=1 Tax=Methylobacterium sp. E-016 TaxID=2836556 RepID=UPI001FBBEA4D|nr:hypothetical protein [Methylobacterium sp. E-016]MCJ2074502.1 hypothetical protein [Methylobacterium sp. E-016]